jgi:hydrogenase maturation protein HypF
MTRPPTGHGLLPIRRSRGYAPLPVRLPREAPPLLAVGGELKNTFCLARDGQAFLSHHIGDLENLEAQASFEAGIAHLEELFRVQPSLIAHDLHPDYRSTRYALARALAGGLKTVAVQHHHAHVAACMAENGLGGEQPVIGVAFDGTGYGPDGAIWGGEFLIADYLRYQRAAHLAYVPLPGGDAATRKPARIALAYLMCSGVRLDGAAAALPPLAALSTVEQRVIKQQMVAGLNAPPTSSMGRLFDAVAAIAGVRQVVDYEGQAAIELEALADPGEDGAYAFEFAGELILPWPVIESAVNDALASAGPAVISARFHNAVAAMILETCLRLRGQSGLRQAALTGGVFQNVTLLRRTVTLLRQAGFEVLLHRLVPPNDGGLALGQAAVAAHSG